MKTPNRNFPNTSPFQAPSYQRGYVSLLAVFTISIFMFSLMLFAYKRAATAQAVQSQIVTQADFREKEETILRSIVALTPNQAIRSMQTGSATETSHSRNQHSFRNIFSDALSQSNARQSIPTELLEELDIPVSFSGNTGDSDLGNISKMFSSVESNNGFTTGGVNRDLGEGFPPALNSVGSIGQNDLYPIITSNKKYGSYASTAFSKGGLKLDPTEPENQKFNLIPYPNINFGYATPGQPFVAKRNWWAFNMDLADFDDDVTQLARFKRQFVLSIYEIPSQLPISASSFHGYRCPCNGDAWENVNIVGNVFAGRAKSREADNLATSPLDAVLNFPRIPPLRDNLQR